MHHNYYRSALTTLAASTVLCGCLTSRYLVPATRFRDTTQQTVSVLGALYSSRNSYEVALYLNDVATDPRLPIELVDKNGHTTPLGNPVFSPASVKARLDALTLVGTYAARLYDLASSQAPAQFETSAQALGSNLTALGSTFQSLDAKGDSTAIAYAAPVSALVGIVGEMYLAKRQDILITAAIEKGGPVVTTILGMLRDDMDGIFANQIVTGLNASLATLIQRYNIDRSTLSYEERKTRTAEITAVMNEEEVSMASAPASLVITMMEANNALIKLASGPSKDRQLNLAAVNSALDAWSAQIHTLVTQIKPLAQ
jgi:hypothetical protein